MADHDLGRVIRAQSGFFFIKQEGEIYRSQIRGRLKQGQKTGDIVAVGDWVKFSKLNDEEGMIEEVQPRANMIYRMDPRPQGEYRQVIIANLDQAVFVFAAAEPEPRLRMLDRFLVVAEQEHISAKIVANKVDLTGMEKAREYYQRYEEIGYPVYYTSTVTQKNIPALKDMLIDQVSLFAGPSGAGKTSLLNQIQPGLGLEVQQVSHATQKGKHTTVVRKMVPLAEGGYVADTPGLKALDLWDTEPEEVDGYFPELRRLVPQCRFSDCTHIHEPGCAVKKALEKGEIHRERYESYLRMREVEEDKIPWL